MARRALHEDRMSMRSVQVDLSMLPAQPTYDLSHESQRVGQPRLRSSQISTPTGQHAQPVAYSPADLHEAAPFGTRQRVDHQVCELPIIQVEAGEDLSNGQRSRNIRDEYPSGRRSRHDLCNALNGVEGGCAP